MFQQGGHLRVICISRHRQFTRGAVAILSKSVAVILYREKPIGTAPVVVARASLLRRASSLAIDQTSDVVIGKTLTNASR